MKPLRIPLKHASSRWLVLPSWRVLHRVARIQWGHPGDSPENQKHYKWIEGTGTTLCGHSGRLVMPGIFSRIGLKRCSRCCKILGIPEGHGNPINSGIDA